MYWWHQIERHGRDEIAFPEYGYASECYGGYASDRNSHKLDKHTFAQLSWADKYSFHVNGPILHQELAKYLDKHITRQDSCDGEEHFFFYSSKKSLQASKDLEETKIVYFCKWNLLSCIWNVCYFSKKVGQ